MARTTYRRSGLIVLVVCLSIALAGCSSSGPAKPKATTPAQKFVAAARTSDAKYKLLTSYSDADLARVGKSVCNVLAHPGRQSFSTNPVDDLVHIGWETAAAAEVVSVAKRTLC